MPPDYFAKQCTLERAQEWKNLVENLVEIEPSVLQFGSLRQWTLFTDVTRIPQSSAHAGLLLDLKDFRVASIVSDDHGRVACNVVFQSIQEYLDAYSKWKDNLQSEKSIRTKHVLELKDVEKTWLRDEWVEEALLCTEFSQFIRVVRNLQQHYG